MPDQPNPSAGQGAGVQTGSTANSEIELTRMSYAFWLAIVGLSLAAILAAVLVFGKDYKSQDVVAVVGLFTSVLGTLVGAFFGLQIGAAGREKEQQATKEANKAAQDANKIAQRALGALAPEQAQLILGQVQ